MNASNLGPDSQRSRDKKCPMHSMLPDVRVNPFSPSRHYIPCTCSNHARMQFKNTRDRAEHRSHRSHRDRAVPFWCGRRATIRIDRFRVSHLPAMRFRRREPSSSTRNGVYRLLTDVDADAAAGTGPTASSSAVPMTASSSIVAADGSGSRCAGEQRAIIARNNGRLYVMCACVCDFCRGVCSSVGVYLRDCFLWGVGWGHFTVSCCNGIRVCYGAITHTAIDMIYAIYT